MTTRATVAKAVGAVLASPKETANQFLYVSSFEITMNEFVASLKKATGVDDWDIEHVKGDEQIEQGKDLLAQGKMWPGMDKLALAATVKWSPGY